MHQCAVHSVPRTIAALRHGKHNGKTHEIWQLQRSEGAQEPMRMRILSPTPTSQQRPALEGFPSMPPIPHCAPALRALLVHRCIGACAQAQHHCQTPATPTAAEHPPSCTPRGVDSLPVCNPRLPQHCRDVPLKYRVHPPSPNIAAMYP